MELSQLVYSYIGLSLLGLIPENISDLFLFLFLGLLGLLTVLLLLHFLEFDLILLFLHLLTYHWRNDLNLKVQAFPQDFIFFQLLHVFHAESGFRLNIA